MRILVYPHDLAIGGSQLNAIEIAAAVNRLGHPTTIVGRPGALVDRIAELGVDFIGLPAPSRRPSRRVTHALIEVINDLEIDVAHGYEWPPTLECLWASRSVPSVTTVSTVMSMAVAPFIPKSVPLLVGTEQIMAAERHFGRTAVGLLEPPVDLEHEDAMDRTAGQQFRCQWGVADSDILLVAVTRLAHQLKLEGLLSAIRAAGQLSREDGLRLLIVGDGPARTEVEAAARAVNEDSGDSRVILTGELTDPRPAYAAADIALGMGGSALRAMAFAKPLVVQGEQGYFRLLTPQTAKEFLWAGWYGRGSGPDGGSAELRTLLQELCRDEGRRTQLGAFGRTLVEQRFSLGHAAVKQLAWYDAALSRRISRLSNFRHEVAGGTRYIKYYAAKRARRAMGVNQSDDFNVRPVTGSTPQDAEHFEAAK